METFLTFNNSPFLVLNYGKQKIATDKIQYIEGRGNYSFIKTNNPFYTVSAFTLKVFSESLINMGAFFSPRKGLLINLEYLEKLHWDNNRLLAEMLNGESLTFSRRGAKRFLEYVQEKNLRFEGLN